MPRASSSYRTGQAVASIPIALAAKTARDGYTYLYPENPVKRRKTSHKYSSNTMVRTTMGSKSYKKVGGKTLKKKVKDLTKMVNADNATHTHKRRSSQRVICDARECAYTSPHMVTPAILETGLANLRYYDPASPSVLVTSNGASGTYSRKFGIHSVYGKIIARNNYRVPAKITIYVVKPKADTDQNPTTMISSGLNDQGGETINNALIYPSDSDDFTALWTIVKSKSMIINPSKQMTMSHSIPAYEYSPSTQDVHSLNYTKNSRSHLWLVRVEGVLSHDSTVVTEQGLAAAGVDLMYDTIITYKYDAGTNLNDVSTTDASDPPSNLSEVGVIYSTNQQFALN